MGDGLSLKMNLGWRQARRGCLGGLLVGGISSELEPFNHHQHQPLDPVSIQSARMGLRRARFAILLAPRWHPGLQGGPQDRRSTKRST